MGREQGGRYREQMKIGWEHGRGKTEGSREEERGMGAWIKKGSWKERNDSREEERGAEW